MQKKRKIELMVRWSILTAGLITLFWTIWYLVVGQVPVVTSIKMTSDWTLQFPFGISRWWDILLGPIWSILIISIFTSEKISKDENLVAGLIVGLSVGLGAGLGVGLGAGLNVGLSVGLGVGLVAGLIVGLGAGLSVGLGVGLVFGLVFGLGVGLGAGLNVGLSVGLGVELVAGIVWLLKLVFSTKFCQTIGNWLMARDI